MSPLGSLAQTFSVLQIPYKSFIRRVFLVYHQADKQTKKIYLLNVDKQIRKLIWVNLTLLVKTSMLILLVVHLTIYTVDAGRVIILCCKKHLKHSSHIIAANICYMYLVRSKYGWRSISERCILFICCLLGYLLVLVYSVTRYFLTLFYHSEK